MRKVAIDLTWVRHGEVGGTEACILNLLDGLLKASQPDMSYDLFVSKDNANLFERYGRNGIFNLIICNVFSGKRFRRILWQNFRMCALLKKRGITVCLEPIYSKPFIGTGKIHFITTIHDLQAIHYPEYFSKARVLWMKINWWNTVRTSSEVVAVSNYVKADIQSHYPFIKNDVSVIYDSVEIDPEEINSVEGLKDYGIKRQEYYFTVSSLLPHKNLPTLIRALRWLKKENPSAFYPLIISGVGGKSKPDLEALIAENELEEAVIFTPYIDDAQRNMLYKYCRAFLFPSIFEGFGMPPIEAMLLGAPAITTRKTSVPEVTQNKAIYVEDPYDEIEWAHKMGNLSNLPYLYGKSYAFTEYKKINIARKYIECFEKVFEAGDA